MHATPIVGHVIGEERFRYLGINGRFILSASTDSYTLNYSADGVTWTAWGEATPAGDNLIVTNAVTGMYFKCVGLGASTKISITY